jgi:hypothetical protein
MATNDRNDSTAYNGDRGISAGAVLATVVALVFLAVALVVGVTVFGGADSKATPMVVTVLGLIGAAIPSIMVLLKVDSTQRELRNGLIPHKVHEAVQQGVEQGTLHVQVNRQGMRERASDSKEGTRNG